MKKIVLLLMLLLTVGLVSCSAVQSDKQYVLAHMDDIDPPQEYTVILFVFSDKIWMAKRMDLNNAEKLFFAPASFEVDGSIYLNDEEAFYIQKEVEGHPDQFTWRLVEEEDLKAIADAIKEAEDLRL